MLYAILNPWKGASCMTSREVSQMLMKGIVGSILSSFQDGCAYVDKDGVILYCNDAYERITGIDRKQLIGYNVYDKVKLGYPVSELTIEVHETRRSHSRVIRYSPGGNDILVTSTPVFADSTGEFLGSVTNFRDMSNLNEIQAVTETTTLQYQTLLAQKEDLLIRLQSRLAAADVDMSDIGIVGKSKCIRNLIELANRISTVNSTVLITGESGVGKDVFCRLIHHLGYQKRPYVKITCAAIPETLLESELFGYEPGAFTGANRRGKTGILEQAENGIVFLDEIDSLPLRLQAKLLTLLQERWYYRVGGTKQVPLDARIIAASNANLKRAVSEGKFREDLYYRLNVIPVHIPPLRERMEDIPHLVDNMISSLDEAYHTKKRFSNDVMAAFKKYRWPGNIRELNNVIERMYILTPGNVIGVEMLPPELSRLAPDTLFLNANTDSPRTLKESLHEVEKHLIWEALRSGRKLKDIADSLGISLSTLERKVRQYNLPLRYRTAREK